MITFIKVLIVFSVSLFPLASTSSFNFNCLIAILLIVLNTKKLREPSEKERKVLGIPKLLDAPKKTHLHIVNIFVHTSRVYSSTVSKLIKDSLMYL